MNAFALPRAIQNASPAMRQHFIDTAIRTVTHLTASEGVNAFISPRREAAAHEAGHCIIFAADGVDVLFTRVWPATPSPRVRRVFKRKRGLFWVGWTETAGLPKIADQHSAVADDLRYVRTLLAGQCGEALDRGGARSGSSLDEIILAQMICQTVASKTGGDAEAIYVRQRQIVVDTLAVFRAEHRQITKALMRQQRLDGGELKQLIRSVAWV
jgi:hypothetical protein